MRTFMRRSWLICTAGFAILVLAESWLPGASGDFGALTGL